MQEDHTLRIQELKDLVSGFCDEREWRTFHNPKELAAAIAIEAGELQELFLWRSPQEIRERFRSDDAYRKRVQEEIADVLIYTLEFLMDSDIDAVSAVREKLRLVAEKYPVEKSRGNNKKYTEL